MNTLKKIHDLILLKKMNKCLDLMMEYQEKNNITKHCVTNSYYLYHNLKAYGINVKTVPTIFICVEGGITKVIAHVAVCLVDYDMLLEPSYEIVKLKEEADEYHYFFKIQDITFPSKEAKKQALEMFLGMAKQSNGINEDKYIEDNSYYHAQADYVDKHLKSS